MPTTMTPTAGPTLRLSRDAGEDEWLAPERLPGEDLSNYLLRSDPALRDARRIGEGAEMALRLALGTDAIDNGARYLVRRYAQLRAMDAERHAAIRRLAGDRVALYRRCSVFGDDDALSAWIVDDADIPALERAGLTLHRLAPAGPGARCALLLADAAEVVEALCAAGVRHVVVEVDNACSPLGDDEWRRFADFWSDVDEGPRRALRDVVVQAARLAGAVVADDPTLEEMREAWQALGLDDEQGFIVGLAQTYSKMTPLERAPADR